MTSTKIALLAAALAVGSALSPAFAAESDDSGQSPLAALTQKAAASTVVEGRQAAPIAAPATTSGAESWLDARGQGEQH